MTRPYYLGGMEFSPPLVAYPVLFAVLFAVLGMILGAFVVFLGHGPVRRELAKALREQGMAEARLEESGRHHAESQGRLRAELSALSQSLVESGGKQWVAKGEESLGHLLLPLHARLAEFQRCLEDGQKQETVQRALLKQEVETLARTGLRLSGEAHRLATALSSQSKAQGLMGEMILEALLSQAGLEPGRDFELQWRGQGESGQALQPDVLVHLPGGRDLVLDAKVSLTAFERWRNCGEGEDAEIHLKAHAQSVKRHIQDLSEKRYQELAGLQTLDFVILFMPLEGAYQAALAADPGLHQMAWEKNLLVLPPSGLIATLRMVAGLWQGELRQRHSQQLAQLAAKLQDKLVAFAEDWDRVQKALNQAQEAWGSAKHRLWSGRGGALATLERMRALGAMPTKEFPLGWRQEAMEGARLPDDVTSGQAGTS